MQPNDARRGLRLTIEDSPENEIMTFIIPVRGDMHRRDLQLAHLLLLFLIAALFPTAASTKEFTFQVRWVQFNITDSAKLLADVEAELAKNEGSFPKSSSIVLKAMRALDEAATPAILDVRHTQSFSPGVPLKIVQRAGDVTYEIDITARELPSGKYRVDFRMRVNNAGSLREYPCEVIVEAGRPFGFYGGTEGRIRDRAPTGRQRTASMRLISLMLLKEE